NSADAASRGWGTEGVVRSRNRVRFYVLNITAILCLLGALPAWAKKSPLEAGLAALSRCDYAAAERIFTAALKKTAPGKAKAALFLNRGLARAQLKRIYPARRDFTRALGEDPVIDLDRDWVPPAIYRIFAETREKLGGDLILEGTPGTVVEVDGQNVGVLP